MDISIDEYNELNEAVPPGLSEDEYEQAAARYCREHDPSRRPTPPQAAVEGALRERERTGGQPRLFRSVPGDGMFDDLPEGAETITFISFPSTPEALERLEPVPQDREPTPSAGEIVALLRRGDPVVIDGPQPGWCVQAVAYDGAVRIEVLDPEYWESAPPLPVEMQRTIEALGFTREPEAWVFTEDPHQDAAECAAALMLSVVERAWG